MNIIYINHMPGKRSSDISRSEGWVDRDVGFGGGFGENHGRQRERERDRKNLERVSLSMGDEMEHREDFLDSYLNRDK